VPREAVCRLQALHRDRPPKRLQGIAELVERQRLHVDLNVGAASLAQILTREMPSCDAHGQRPGGGRHKIEAHHPRLTTNNRSSLRCERHRL